MTAININNSTQTTQYNLVISRIDESGTDNTTRVVVSDNFLNQVSVINIEQGPVGDRGPQGEPGPAGRDAIQFSILPISSGGTNNTFFDSGNIVFYDGTRLSTSTYSIQDILDEASLASNAITGILSGSGIYKTESGNTITLNTSIGEGLEIDSNNRIVVDDTIARVAELDLGEIQGQVPISKGGTNNNFFNSNKLVYYDGTKLRSFPMATGNFLFSGISIDIVAGSGLVGGGSVNIPDGSITLNIPSSADVFVDNDSIVLSETGIAGTYSKVTTDSKGRVIEGTSLTVSDIIAILGYTPYHPGNDGAGSNLDADLLDGQQGAYYTDASNLTGTINTQVLPNTIEPGTYTKVAVGSNGLVTDVFYANQSDIISSLGYTPVPNTGIKTINGDTTLQGNVTINGELEIYDHLPLLATDNPDVLPDTPRGISFIYGGLFSNKTGILAYYPADNELKLVTNVFGSGADIDGDGDSDYQDDINGGDAEAVFILQNLDGDASTILLRDIADNLYVKTSTNEEIGGLKTFLDGIQVVRQIKITNPPGNTIPPLEIYENTNKVTNLNADLLDGQDGTYYTEAGNMTGAFSYDNVTFDHIEGVHKYIPVFNDTQNIPANRITSSVVKQDPDDNIIIEQNKSVSISSGSDIASSTNSMSIGPNTISGSNALAAGTDNIVLSNNAIALNSNSKAAAINSVALGTYGRTYLPNQVSFGAFQRNDLDTGELLQHAQHTTITAHLESVQAGNSWTSLTPTITIPQNTTIAYEAELLVSKTFGTGVAHYKFNSGLFKNATFRNANNLVEVINLTTQPQPAKRNELFNNSQIKNHYYAFRHPNSLDFQQDVHIRRTIQTNALETENDKQYYEFTAIPKTVTGIYEKTNDGNLILDINYPSYSGSFSSDLINKGVKIYSRNHGVANNSLVNLKFSNISSYHIDDGYYKVYSVIDNDTFFAERPFYTGFLSYYSGTTTDYAQLIINRSSMPDINFVSGLLDISSRIYVETPSEGIQYFSNGVLSSGYDYNDNLSLHIAGIEIAKRQTYPSGIEVSLLPLALNSGSVSLVHKENISGTFHAQATIFNKIPGIYTRRKHQDNTYSLEIHTSASETIHLPHTPLSYELVSGYKDDDNDSFEIENINDQYFLKAKSTLDYEVKNIYYVRIKATDRSNSRFKEKYFTLTVNDTRSPYTLFSIPDQSVDISETFNYTIPPNLFNPNEIINYNYVVTQGSLPNTASNVFWYDVAYGNNTFVAVARSSNTSAISSDGINWTSGTLPDFQSVDHWKSIYFLNNTFIALQYYADSLATSNDGINWTTRTLPDTLSLSSIAYGNGVFFAIGYTGGTENYSTMSTDGINWSSTNLPDDMIIYDIAYGNNKFIVTGFDSFFISEDDGDTWTEISIPYSSTWKITFGQGIFLASTGSRILISDDGITWTLYNTIQGNYEFPLNKLLYLDNIFVRVFDGFLEYSRDGINWKVINLGLEKHTYSATFDGNNLILLDYYHDFSYRIDDILETISYRASQQNGNDLPEWLSFDSQTLNFNGSPSGCDLGTYNIRVYAENNFSEIYEDFYLTVTDVSVQIFDAESSDSLEITDIQLSATSVDENLPSGSIFSQISGVGSYLPYMEFQTAENNFSGILVSNKDTFEAKNISMDFPLVSISGDVGEIPKSGLLENSRLPENCRVVNIYKPFALSGTPGLTDGRIYFTDSYRDYQTTFFSGLDVYTTEPLMLPFFTIQSFNDYSVFVGDRLALSTELITEFPELIKTENNDIIVTRHSNIRNTLLATEESDGVRTQDEESLIIANDALSINVIWASGYPGCDDADLIEDQIVSFTPRIRDYNIEINTSGNLDNFNLPPQSGLKRSNIKYGEDLFSFRDAIENPVLAMYGVGSGDLCTLLSEDNNLMTTEDSDDIISNNENHHGTRIEINKSYEFFENYRVVKDNGKLLVNKFDQFLTEDNQPIVHDYAIAARSGDVCLLFPGVRQGEEKIIYPDTIDLSDTTYNYYYNWGKLIQFAFTNDKYFVKIDSVYTGDDTTTLIKYSNYEPSSQQYNISGIQEYQYNIQSGNCPIDILATGIKGFETSDNTTQQEYVTGIVDIYVEAGIGNISLDFAKDINLDNRYTNHINLHTVSSTNESLDLPLIQDYTDIQITDPDSITIKNYFYLPNSGIAGTGQFTANIDRNHGYVEESSSIINRVPVKFSNCITTLSGVDNDVTHRPKNYTFDVISVNGNKIIVKDNKNYLLKESGRPDYYDQTIDAEYLTNGIKFSGSLFHDHPNIYDVRYNINNITNTYDLIPFSYDYETKKFSFTIASGLVKPFDEVVVTFPSGFVYSTGVLGALITKDKVSPYEDLKDLEPYKDNILLETSKVVEGVDNEQEVSITGILPNIIADFNGSCVIDNNITNRLQSGLLINHSGSNILGYQINSFVSGFNFTGAIPKNNNVISTNITGLINDDHIGHASIFGTGNNLLYQGARILREATAQDIGYAEYYLIDTNAPELSVQTISGVGSLSNKYRHYLQNSGTNIDNNRYIEFVYLGQNSNQINIQGNYSVSGGVDKFRIYHTTFTEQAERFREANNDEDFVIFDTKIFETGRERGFGAADSILNLSLQVNRFDKIKIELDIPSGQHVNHFDLFTYVVSGIDIKPYILESTGIINQNEDYYPYINPKEPDLVYLPIDTLTSNNCIDCNTNLPQYIPLVDPNYSSLLKHDFHIMPYIKTNNKYCGEEYDKNKQVFFNGNIIEISNLSTQKSYLIKDDELKILQFNSTNLASSGVTKYIHKFNSSDENNIISGISIRGDKNVPARSSEFIYPLLFQDQDRFNGYFGISHDMALDNTGIIKFIKSTSGEFDVLDYNNIHYHTYGGSTAHYPLDINGINVPYCQTGIYSISSDTSSCTSGTLCITISGYKISSFSGIVDFADRSNLGQRTNILTDANGIKGAVRPYGSEKKFYFDFDDGAPGITNIYYIEDMLSPNVITIKTPYNSDYVGRSGIVFIIDSDQNIKSHLNPNLDNQLIISDGSMTNIGDIEVNNFNYFDHSTKRWKHTAHIHEQPALTGHNARIATNQNVDLLSIGPEKISIADIQYSIDDSDTYNAIENNSIIIPSNISEIIFKIRTTAGDNSLFSNTEKSMPKVSISGIGTYRIEMDDLENFGRNTDSWDIGARCTTPAETGYNRSITIKASDLTGSDEQTINIQQYLQPDITPIYTGYATTGNNWSLGFDISHLDLDTKLTANEIRLDFEDEPLPGYFDRSYVDDRSVIYTGLAPMNTGLYYPTLSIIDLTTSPYETIDTFSGSLVVLDHISDKPDFDLQLNNFESNYYLNIDNQERLTFEIPAELGPAPSEVLNNLSITFTTNPEYNMYLYSSSYNSNTKRFEIIAIPHQTGSASYVADSAKYTNQIVGISLKQAVYDSFGNYTYQTYTKSFGFNLNLYNDTSIELIPAPNERDLFFNTDSAWSVDFYVLSGITEHDQFNRPNIRVFGAPNLSPYGTNPLEYSVDYEYSTEKKAWKVSVTSKKDIFGDYVNETGIYPISIFAEDRYSSYDINNEINIIYYHTSKRRNVEGIVYGTPDNIFFTKADSFNLDEKYTQSEISIPSNLKEESIELNLIDKLYDRDLSIWQYGYISDPMTDKYDARILLTENSITLQCKGLGSDKIIAAGKLNTIEIENNELQGLPLTITGIVDYGVESGTIVAQGEDKWELKFKTIGGLAHENYPPTILLSDMPTACTGFDPLLEEQMQCAAYPVWNSEEFGGSWSYSFTGLPSCVLLGEFPFTITAIDTDSSLLPSNPYIGSDSADHLITYTETVFSGLPPVIQPDSENNQTTIKPLCNNTLYRNKLYFGPATGSFCLGPTGIKSFEISGLVPPGLSYSIFFPEDGNTPQSPYANLGSGHLLIEGYPSTFASGAQYAEELRLIVTDARDLSTDFLVTFTDSSTPIEPDVSIAVYFKDSNPALTPSTGLKPILGGTIKAWRPSPTEASLICNSVLPHNLCKIIDVIYSGQTGADTRIFLHDLDTDDDLVIAEGDEIYIDLADSSNDEIDGVYTIATGQGLPYIDAGITPQPATGLARLVKSEYKDVNILNYDNLFENTNIINSTTKCVLGGGIVDISKVGQGQNTRGLMGTIVPSFKASVTGLDPFESDNSRYSGLEFTRINPSVDIVSTVAWSDCWQTGYLYLSGIVVPPVSVEIVDPPPAQDYDFSFNGSRFALATRLSIGVTETQKLLPGNERSASLTYTVTNILTDTIIQNGSVGAGSSFDTIALSSDSGTFYKINILKESDLFPTYSSNALPGDDNDYIWIHKGDNLTTTPTQSSFPPILTFGFDSISVINDLDDSDPQGQVMDPIIGIALGGYIPSSAGIGEIEPYSVTGISSDPWFTSDYLPILSGIIQSGLNKQSLTAIDTDYSSLDDTIIVQNTSFSVGDAIAYEFYTLDNQLNKIVKDSGSLIIDTSNINDNNYFTYTKDLGALNIEGLMNIEFKSYVYNIENNQLIIRHSDLPFETGDSICIDKNSYQSTELSLLYNHGEISIVSGDNELMYLENSNGSTDWHEGFASGDIVSIFQNLNDNIKIMPFTVINTAEGRYGFQITGRSNIFENVDLEYKICTAENSGMPVFNSTLYPSVNMAPKKHFINYPLYINKPISIITGTVAKNGDTLSFSTLGGKRPIQNHTPDVQIAAGVNDLGYCGFFRESISGQIKDEYDSVNDRLNIRITLSNDYGIDWSQHNSLKIRVSDETGSDEYIFNY